MSEEIQGRAIVGGVDTHKDAHVVADIDTVGRLLCTQTFATTAAGYRALVAWVQSFGTIQRFGIEGTSSYGAGLTRFVREAGIPVVEVNRPNRQFRRQRGKSDHVDAEAAARAALIQELPRVPKAQDGVVELLRIIRVQRRSAIHARTQAANQVHALIASAPEVIRARLRDGTISSVVSKLQRRRTFRTDLERITHEVLRALAKRWSRLAEEIASLDTQINTLVRACAPGLLARRGIGPEVASALLVAAGDNPERLRNEQSFAALCGVAPLDASSGRQQRHRLNRGGNRDANRALWVIAFVRLRIDPVTKAYMARRQAEGRTKLEVIRCLKRYIAREVFKLLQPICGEGPAPA